MLFREYSHIQKLVIKLHITMHPINATKHQLQLLVLCPTYSINLSTIGHLG